MNSPPAPVAPLALAAVALALAGCGLALSAAGYPPEALRKTPPAGIEGRVRQIGTTAPGFSLTAADGTTRSLKSLLARGPAVIVFYRGPW